MQIRYTSKFKKDYKRIKRQGLDLGKMASVLRMIAAGSTLPDRFRDHELMGEYQGNRECHIAPDRLLIYRGDEGELMLIAIRTGSHSELFGK